MSLLGCIIIYCFTLLNLRTQITWYIWLLLLNKHNLYLIIDYLKFIMILSVIVKDKLMSILPEYSPK